MDHQVPSWYPFELETHTSCEVLVPASAEVARPSGQHAVHPALGASNLEEARNPSVLHGPPFAGQP